ncbi:MAG: response regulator [Epsilonproteobacteria bacterium]|nr:response regulator [Campylobacterota bacterium]
MDLTYDILVVDDIGDNIKVAMNILHRANYNFSFALNGQEALKIAKIKNFDLILLDVMMPKMNGFDVCKNLKKSEKTKDIPIIFITAKNDIDSIARGFELGGVDYITKPFQAEELSARVANHLELWRAKKVLKQNNLDLKTEIQHKTEIYATELERAQKDIIDTLAELIESTSDETGQHVKRVANISKHLAYLHTSMSEDDERTIFLASPLHDVGKITINPNIIHKPAKLTIEEFEKMKKHTTNAHNLLKNSKRKLIKSADIIAYEHHEKWDGTGYPRGLKGENIHIFGRIVALADVFDALTHKREYKSSWTFQESAKYIMKNSGIHFDPYLVDLFIQNLEDFRKILEE